MSTAASKVKVAMNKSTIQVVRSVCHEMKSAAKQIKSQNESIRYFIKQCRLYQTTDERVCKGKHEPRFVAETYLTYLQSTRRYNEIQQAYAGKGERGVAETANLVGFKLPHDS